MKTRKAVLMAVAVGAMLPGACSQDKCANGPCGGESTATAALSAPTVADARRLVADPLLAPRFSPDGRHLLAAGEKFAGLFVLPVEGGTAQALTREEFVGWSARWGADGIVTRTRDDREVRFEDPTGTPRRQETGRAWDPRRGDRPVAAWAADDQVRVRQDGAERVVAAGDDRYYAAEVSPDGRQVAVEGLEHGIVVVDLATGQRVAVGRGNHPAWLPDSSGFLYDVTRDDGRDLTDGDLWLWTRAGATPVQLTDTPGRVETRPAVSPDGRTVAWQQKDGLWIGTLRP